MSCQLTINLYAANQRNLSLSKYPHKGGSSTHTSRAQNQKRICFLLFRERLSFSIGRSWFQLLPGNFLCSRFGEEACIRHKREKCIRMQLKLVRSSVMLFAAYPCAGNRGWESERTSLKREMDARPAEFQVRVCTIKNRISYCIFLRARRHGCEPNALWMCKCSTATGARTHVGFTLLKRRTCMLQ